MKKSFLIYGKYIFFATVVCVIPMGLEYIPKILEENEQRGILSLPYILGTWFLAAKFSLLTHHPDDWGFDEYLDKNILIRGVISFFCLLLSGSLFFLPILAVFYHEFWSKQWF